MVLFKVEKDTADEILYRFYLEREDRFGGIVAIRKKDQGWRFVEQSDFFSPFYAGMIYKGIKNMRTEEQYPAAYSVACY